MDTTTIPPVPPPVQPADALPNVQPAVPPVMPKKKSRKGLLFTMVLLPIVVMAIIIPALMKPQSITGEAAGGKCRLITKVAINPGEIKTSVTAAPTELSVLAYDYYGVPITNGVKYDWGMSSIEGIGTVKARHDLATFIPSRLGTGDLYVKTKNSCTNNAVIGSIKVAVLPHINITLPPTPVVTVSPRIKLPTPPVGR
jgi:hypothetical protein